MSTTDTARRTESVRFEQFRAPSVPEAAEARVGPVDAVPAGEVVRLLPRLTTWPAPGSSKARSWVRGAGVVLDWLETVPGEGWQARWQASGADQEGKGWIDELVAGQADRSPDAVRGEIVGGLAGLLLCRVVLPSYDFLVGYGAVNLFRNVRRELSPDVFDRVEAATGKRGMAGRQVAEVLTVLSKIVLNTGKDVDQITAKDIFTFRAWNISRYSRHKSGLHGAWDILRDVGVLDADATLRATLRQGQPTIEEMVARRQIRCRPVRDVLVRYLSERAPSMDFSSLRQLATTLAGTFWADIEHHHPDIDTLDLPTEVADAWKHRLAHVTKKGFEGRERKGRLEILARVRTFYLDIQEWAHEDASWTAWAVRSPVHRNETEGVAKRNRVRTAEVHQRIRERLPHLPVLVDTAERHRAKQTSLLAAARAAALGEVFEHEDTTYRRTAYNWDGRRSATQHGPEAVLVENTATGETSELLREEENAFWAWAIIEALRHTGVRIEELLEITHLALVSYRLPETREIVPLLQIVPSKSNAERLLLVTPELASVLAAVIHRIRGEDGRVPVAARYDPHERFTGPLLPHLFQRKIGWRREIISTKVLYRLLNETLLRTGLTDRAGQPSRYTPHDFRRIFATDAVTGGLPVHIAAKILGHHNLSTTHAYLNPRELHQMGEKLQVAC